MKQRRRLRRWVEALTYLVKFACCFVIEPFRQLVEVAEDATHLLLHAARQLACAPQLRVQSGDDGTGSRCRVSCCFLGLSQITAVLDDIFAHLVPLLEIATACSPALLHALVSHVGVVCVCARLGVGLVRPAWVDTSEKDVWSLGCDGGNKGEGEG